MVRRLFGLASDEPLHVVPITNLSSDANRERLVEAVLDPDAPRQFLTFQQLFGGEISLPRTDASPELAFDVTVVEVVSSRRAAGGIELARYGVIELQTTDTHGSYRHAVKALRDALDLHGRDFAEQVAEHPDWPGRKVEGPNISNVFKRTFYQVMFKFQIAKRSASAGCILALPRPVWESWQPFLGAPHLIDNGDGTHRLAIDDDDGYRPSNGARNWIYVFDIDERPPADGGPTAVQIPLVIVTDAPTLSRLALESAPSNAVGDLVGDDTVLMALRRRVSRYLADLA
jgi:hypothetical protein